MLGSMSDPHEVGRADAPRDPLNIATLVAVAMIAQHVAGKATRDALFLSNFPVTSLPMMLIVASLTAIGASLVTSRLLARAGPWRVVPLAFVLSALLLLGVWWLATRHPGAAAVLLFMHISIFGGVLISGFWSLVSESFDPRTARKSLGRIAAGATFGGLAGGLLAERIGAWGSVETLLPVMAGIHVFCAWRMLALRPPAEPPRAPEARDARSGFEVLAGSPYLRTLALLVVVMTVAVAFIDYVFKAQAAAAFTDPAALVRFFALFYTGVSVVTFLLQTAIGASSLERFGPARLTGVLPGAVLLGGVGALVIPGLGSIVAARGSGAAVESSLYRSGYELLYTPVPEQDKRAVKSIVDVALERVGDAAGAGIVALVLVVAPLVALSPNPTLLVMACALGAAGFLITRRLGQGYVTALERSLLDRAEKLHVHVDRDSNLMRTMTAIDLDSLEGARRGEAADEEADPLLPRIAALRSGRVVDALAALVPPEPALVPFIIPLIASPNFYDPVCDALCEMVDQVTGQLVDALLDPTQPFVVRRRLPGVIVTSRNIRAVYGLLEGLDDPRFEVRFRCGRALAMLHASGALLPPEAVYAAVLREVTVGKQVWDSQRILELDDSQSSFVDDQLRERATRSMEHVFTLLSLVLPEQPLQVAFKGLHSGNKMLRGTALEYLESILPPPIREALWPFLEQEGAVPVDSRSREEVLQDLIDDDHSVILTPAQLKKLDRG